MEKPISSPTLCPFCSGAMREVSAFGIKTTSEYEYVVFRMRRMDAKAFSEEVTAMQCQSCGHLSFFAPLRKHHLDRGRGHVRS